MTGRDQPRRAWDVREVTPDRWLDLVALFERRGPRGGSPMPGACWCMWWRERSGDAEQNKRAMRAIVRSGEVPGLLAYDGSTPVGWVSVAPRGAFGQLVRSRTIGPDVEEVGASVYAITCFYVDPRAKRAGVAHALAHGAVTWALERGADVVEAYPNLRPDYMGSAAIFEELGFAEHRRADKRLIMRLEAPS